MTLLQVMVEYSQTPGQPFSLGGLLASPAGRWIVIGVGLVAVIMLFRRSKLSTLLFLIAMAALVYYGRGRIGW